MSACSSGPGRSSPHRAACGGRRRTAADAVTTGQGKASSLAAETPVAGHKRREGRVRAMTAA